MTRCMPVFAALSRVCVLIMRVLLSVMSFDAQEALREALGP